LGVLRTKIQNQYLFSHGAKIIFFNLNDSIFFL
jgi:hypothetical protein